MSSERADWKSMKRGFSLAVNGRLAQDINRGDPDVKTTYQVLLSSEPLKAVTASRV
jgi:hypothetical protein